MTDRPIPDATPTPGVPLPAANVPEVTNSTIGRASALLASGTLVSRILGFLSAMVLARTLGLFGTSDTYAIANQLPKAVYAIVAGGVLSAVIVPQIVRAALHKDGGQKFINRLVTLGIVVFLVITVAATLSAPLLVQVYARPSVNFGPAEFALATAFAYWCLPQILFYALYSLLGEVLNARGKFGPFTWAPVANNVVMLIGLLVFSLLFGDVTQYSSEDWTPQMIGVLAGGATLGVAVQATLLAFFWRRAGLHYRPEFRWRGVGLGNAGKAAAWTFGMILVTQVAGAVGTQIASLASTVAASVFVITTAWLIFMLPHSVISVSIGMAYFTRMSGHARDGNLTAMRDDVSAAIRSILMLLMFAAIGLMVIAFPFSALFSTVYAEQSSLAIVLIIYLVGLVPFSIMYILQRVFYAFEDTRTPFILQTIQVLVYVAGALYVSTFPLDRIAMGLAAMISIAGTMQTIIALIVVRKRVPGFQLLPLVLRALWFLAAMIPSAAAGFGILALLGGLGEGSFAVSGFAGAFVSIALSGTGMLIVYAATLALTRNSEFFAFARPIVSRLRRH
ncbi:murein biosynthesis integral membrane protein MurJ [Salinibacterium sp. NG253]|uniref:murein biosynthesis integral membrane protein MurJ n=1 Tax=Salinibacterium sp. NG253 TaxID=2792039 RepID=UPI0018CE5ACF|nr:murein biosynthesis integral membrane protein MurJ [Salinibacterium sp. NG253]MBH0116904.1 murein biosynthesis integral membrane protein MurJ [Salinibacterium sp. NG253]